MDGQPEAVVDLDAVQANVAAISRHVGSAQVMAVVKSDGYGHGMLPSARAALAGGATWLGVVHVADAIELRRAGLTVPVLSLHGSPDSPHAEAIRHDVDLTAGTAALVDQIALAAEGCGRTARLHLEADTGMSRGGAIPAAWPGLVRTALAAQAAGRVQIVGLWSHFACADIPGHPSIAGQLDAFRAAVAVAETAGVTPEVRHLANGPATLALPESYFDLVRPGGAVFGLSTLPGGAPDWLRPAMTLRARLIQVKRVPAGTPVSYAHRYATSRDTRLGVLPLGYNEGIPRHATNADALLFTGGRRVAIAGTVNLNHIIVDLGPDAGEAGDEVIVFGPGDRGEPTAQEWADALGTIAYEIVTRFTGKVPRTYSGVTTTEDGASTRGRPRPARLRWRHWPRTGELMARWRRLSSVAGLATGIAAASAGAVIAAEKVAVGRIRLRPDPARDEPLGELRGTPVEVVADDGVRLYTEVSGPPDAPVTIVFCHGYTLSQEIWHYQRRDLESRARLVFWDQRSHGRSGRSDPANVSIDQLGRDLDAVLAATVPADAPAVLAGHSMGGMTIMALAGQRPELFGPKVIGVALISTTAYLVDATGWLPAPLRPLARWAGPGLLRSSSRGRRAELTEWVRSAANDLSFLSTRFIAFGDPDVSPAVVDFLERVIRATPIDVIADFYLTLLEHDQRAALDVIGRVPTVVVTGTEDRLIGSGQTAELAAAIPGARLVCVPEAGHMALLERPEVVTGEIAGLVAEALARAARRSPA